MPSARDSFWRHCRFQHPVLRAAQEKGLEEYREEGRRALVTETAQALLHLRGYTGLRDALDSASVDDLWSWVPAARSRDVA